MKGDYTKAKSITQKTKQSVWDRQNGVSIFSQIAITKEQCCCHFVPRSASGVGYEWNIFGATQEEHDAFDQHKPIIVKGRIKYTSEQAHTLVRNHLIVSYNNWTLENCKYKKWFEESEYGVTRRESKHLR